MIELVKLWKRRTLPVLIIFSLLPLLVIPISRTWWNYEPKWEDFVGISPSPLFAFTPYLWSWLIPILIGVEAVKVDEGLVQYTLPPLGRRKYFLLKVFSVTLMLTALYMPLALALSIIYSNAMPIVYGLVYLVASLQLSLLASTLSLYASPVVVVILTIAIVTLVQTLRILTTHFFAELGYSSLPLLSPFGVATNFAERHYLPLAFSALWSIAFAFVLYLAVLKKDF